MGQQSHWGNATWARGGRLFRIMGEIPTPCEAVGLTELARQFRASARDTIQMEYVRVFVSAALALEARARGGHTDPNFDRHLYQR
jgi:hypothetical protein